MLSEERKAFGRYADALGLDAGTVATLLMIRELRLGRLGRLRVSPELRQPRNTSGTITSHRFGEARKARFREHLDKLSLSASEGLGVLCRAELKEHWLEAALSGDSEGVRT